MKMLQRAARVERPKQRPSVSGFLLLTLLLFPLAAHAQSGSSPFDTGLTSIQTLFTGTIAKVSSLIAIVLGGYPLQLKFDYTFKNEDPFAIQSIYHDDKFTYIKTTASEKFSVYEMKDGKPDLINYDLRDGTYIIPKIVDKGYIEIGKKHMDFSRKG